MSSALKEMGTNYSDIELDSGFEKRLDNLRLNPVPNPVDEAKEGPSDEDKEASKKLQSPSLLNRFFSSRLGRYLLALGGSAGSLSLAAACTPAPQQAEVRTVTQSRIETADMKSKIQVIHETSPDKSVETWKVVASNPSRNQQAEFMFINTIENGQKKSIVAFPKDGKNTSSDYRMANYTDSENQAHLVYLASNDSSFIDFRLDIGVPEKLDDQFTQKVFNASENIETINGVTITNLATGEQAIFEKEGNNDLFKELLQALTTKKAQAAELPATPTITPTATATKTPEPIPTPTAKPTEIPTPEVVKEVPCNIVPEKYCSQAEVIDWTGPTGQKGKMIGFHLPPEVPLFVPIDGQVAKAKLPDGVINGFEAIVFNPSDKTLRYIFDGDLQFDNMFSLNMKKGDVFGYTGKTGIENAGSYNVLFYILRGTGRDTTNAEDEMEKMFPEAFTKPAKQVTAPQVGKVGTVHINTFYDTSPK